MAIPQFTYISNIPQPTQKKSQTQKSILGNFHAIKELIDINHVDFSNDNYGKHTFLTLPAQGSAPTTTATQMALYAAAIADPNGMEIFYRYPSSGAIGQLTSLGGPALNSANGYCYLGGSVLMKWGLATGLVLGDNIITFPVAVGTPVFTTVSIVQSSPAIGSVAIGNGAFIKTITTTTFTINFPSTVITSVYWYAIGV
jgi:hypothetical protein